MPSNSLEYLRDVFVDRTAGLRSQHFLLIGVFEISIEKVAQKKSIRLNMEAFESNEVREAFRNETYGILQGQALSGEVIASAFHEAAKVVLPLQKAVQRKPWISDRTLGLIDQRNALRIVGDHSGEIELQKAIRRSVKIDRAVYLDELVSAGAWTQLKMLRRGPNKMKGRLRN